MKWQHIHLARAVVLVAVVVGTNDLLMAQLPNAFPPAKQVIEDQYNKERNEGVANPAPHDPNTPAKHNWTALIPLPPLATGILNEYDADPTFIRSLDFAPTNWWQGIIGGVVIEVLAGTQASLPQQGMIVIMTNPDYSPYAPGSIERLPTPDQTGALTITTVLADSPAGPQLAVVTDGGTSYVFDVPSRTFLVHPTPTATITPTPTSTPQRPFQGFVPPDKKTAKCESRVVNSIGRLAACFRKCHIKRADLAARGKLFDEERCEIGSGKPPSCRARYDTAGAAVIAKAICPACLDATAQSSLADSLASALENEEGTVYCAGSIVFGGDDPGFVPQDKNIGRCEDSVTKDVSTFAGCVGNCEVKQADVELKGKEFDKNACVNVGTSACRTKYDAASAKLEPKPGKPASCPACLGMAARGTVADAAREFLEQNQSRIYCFGSKPLS